MHAMTAVSSVNQPQNDRKSVVFCKRPARTELFRDAVFFYGRPAPAPTRRDFAAVDLSFQARGVCPLPNHTSIPCKCTVLVRRLILGPLLVAKKRNLAHSLRDCTPWAAVSSTSGWLALAVWTLRSGFRGQKWGKRRPWPFSSRFSIQNCAGRKMGQNFEN